MVIIVVKLSRQWLAGKVQSAANGAAKRFEKSYFMQAKLRGLYHFFFIFSFPPVQGELASVAVL